MSLFPVILVAHVTLAIALFVPSVLLPFTLRSRRWRAGAAEHRPGAITRLLLWLQSHGTLVIGFGLALTGAALIWNLGIATLRQPWLLLALSIYAANLVAAYFVQRPNLRRLLGLRSDATDAERERWRERARRQRYVSYVMAAAVGVIGFLMSTKPNL